MKLLKKFSKKKFNSALLKIWLKKALYYISYPFRLWGVWLFILIVAYLGPTFRGVKPAEVHLWYWEKVTSCFSSISELFSEQTYRETLYSSMECLKAVYKKIVNERADEKIEKQISLIWKRRI